ncbi:MAG: DUF4294 domain-containing protein [Chitinophagaceae bacterium]|nr:DUF4294 domain-containing protein [Chitinophagaceae bacterium]MBL0306130.1 DUF4294 domain-containing protein [Chitinophagaceae bacterium]MBP6215439.1 DUF4294 domain-containing protein [Chitinophagaceae bacterium]
MTKYLKSIVLCATLTIMPGMIVIAQVQPPSVPVTDTNPPLPPMSERMKNWGPNDTIIVPAIWYQREIVNYKEMDMAWVSNLSPEKLAKFIEEWTRLRNAVYVTYPYARIAGATINDINANLAKVSSKKERKGYIKSREKELKKQFSDPLSNLSVYQGKILMKLINRQTGNNCYEIIKEYKGGLNARFYQTVAFFVGGNLKQDWSIAKNKTDRDIENIVKEIDGSWYNNPYRR